MCIKCAQYFCAMVDTLTELQELVDKVCCGDSTDRASVDVISRVQKIADSIENRLNAISEGREAITGPVRH